MMVDDNQFPETSFSRSIRLMFRESPADTTRVRSLRNLNVNCNCRNYGSIAAITKYGSTGGSIYSQPFFCLNPMILSRLKGRRRPRQDMLLPSIFPVVFLLMLVTRMASSTKLLAKFDVDSVSAHSIVMKMIATDYGIAAAVATPLALDERLVAAKSESSSSSAPSQRMPKCRVEMKVIIFDLDRMREFRRSELTATVNFNSQLFSFDGLLADTWFALRIDYRLLYYDNTAESRDGMSKSGKTAFSQGGSSFLDFPTKQEVIVRTKPDNPPSSVRNSKNSVVSDLMKVEDEAEWRNDVIRFESIALANNRLNVTLSSAFAERPMLTTLVVPEMRCLRGTLKPPAQRVTDAAGVMISFDLSRLVEMEEGAFASVSHNDASSPRNMAQPNRIEGGESSSKHHHHQHHSTRRHHTNNRYKAISPRNVLSALGCYQLCVFPFVRAEKMRMDDASGGGVMDSEQTFRTKEFCDSVQAAARLAKHKASGTTSSSGRIRQQRLRSTANMEAAGDAETIDYFAGDDEESLRNGANSRSTLARNEMLLSSSSSTSVGDVWSVRRRLLVALSTTLIFNKVALVWRFYQ